MEEKQYTTKKRLVIEYREEEGVVVEKRCFECKEWYSIDNYPALKGSFLNKKNHCYPCEARRAKAFRRSHGAKPREPEIIVENGITSRNCSKCKLMKRLDDFDKSASGYLGHDSECSECKRRRGELYRRDKGIRPQRKVPILTDEFGIATHRECCRCLKMLPLNQYAKHGGGTVYLGVHPYCKGCAAERHLISKYGLTSEDKARMHKAQNEVCGICQEKVSLNKIHVDHCHTTGQVRGLLCSACNKALGLLKDNPERCKNMAAYLLASSIADRHSK